jgi:oligopeptide/dipeptide ABC transporter ATP-binding protein
MSHPSQENLLEIQDLQVGFNTPYGFAKAVDGLNLTLKKGEILGLVGESGSGKSVSSLSILRLIQIPPGKIVSGKILFKGKDILSLSDSEMIKLRGNEIGMVFQEPMTSLNPVFTIGEQIAEVLMVHESLSKAEALKKTIELLKQVKIPSPEQRIHEYPHQLSGGMRQRVMIAMAMACQPELLIADEPTTALDVTVQSQILDLMKELRDTTGSAILLITHDLGVVAETADRVAVMYAGQILEEAPVEKFFKIPLHPYSRGLLESLPHYQKNNKAANRLFSIPGSVPNPLEYPEGCRFHPRCPYVKAPCKKGTLELNRVRDNHFSRCLYSNDFLLQKEADSKSHESSSDNQ